MSGGGSRVAGSDSGIGPCQGWTSYYNSQKGGSWDPAWCVLTGERLTLYFSPRITADQVIFSYTISQYCSLHCKKTDSGSDYHLEIWVGERQIIAFKVKSSQERDMWRNRIQARIADTNDNRVLPHHHPPTPREDVTSHHHHPSYPSSLLQPLPPPSSSPSPPPPQYRAPNTPTPYVHTFPHQLEHPRSRDANGGGGGGGGVGVGMVGDEDMSQDDSGTEDGYLEPVFPALEEKGHGQGGKEFQERRQEDGGHRTIGLHRTSVLSQESGIDISGGSLRQDMGRSEQSRKQLFTIKPSWFFDNCTREQAERVLRTCNPEMGNTLMRTTPTEPHYKISKRCCVQGPGSGFNIDHYMVVEERNGYRIDVVDFPSVLSSLEEVMAVFVQQTGPRSTLLLKTNNMHTLMRSDINSRPQMPPPVPRRP